MYNEESDEDEQLLKKEHKGMIYRRTIIGWRPIFSGQGSPESRRAVQDLEKIWFSSSKFSGFIRGKDFRFWPLEGDYEITTFQTCKTNTYSMRLLCLPDCGSLIFWKLETNFTVVFSIKYFQIFFKSDGAIFVSLNPEKGAWFMPHELTV